MNIRKILSISILFLVLFLVSCPPIIEKKIKTIIVMPKEDVTNNNSNNNTVAEFWALPGITFVNWRPNIHIKGTTDNGTLTGRKWDGTPDINPDLWSLFEYSQVLYYDSDYTGFNIPADKDVTIDNTVIMPLAFEQKLYKRTIQAGESPKYDVTYDIANKAVVITLNTENSNYLTLKTGTRIAVFATQRPTQWGAQNDYTIIDSFPSGNSLQKTTDSTIKDNTSDRSVTRKISYITYNGGVQDISSDNSTNHWFKGLKLEQAKITIYMPHLATGDDAKKYWDTIDKTPLAPFMLFWIAIQQ
ncbi:MAG: hypothetical protein A2086_02395 [Spirochaetes bacterium GWD1_27_9]|nr:MAG: hypothetical protein A2Z98_08260 [Spirochaetes bacterium GWB1_27_13]OHD27763.1 MAG: hypothetical protein A2Y34_08990 [Spirochaetes bacterium GWC1_27_15]OHD31580.1 MAG: hypothetical protein A2086_02395 [Spirochaetes bacterium GWD1_27_9]